MTAAEIVGTVELTSSIVLNDVLYLPKFSFNLISISKLAKSSGCSFQFCDGYCHIQDRSRKMIGSGDMVNGLYYLNLNLSSNKQDSSTHCAARREFCNAISIPDSALRHFRLGHISSSRFEMLCKKVPYIQMNKIGICNVCHFAKQKRVPFSLSNSKHKIHSNFCTWTFGDLFQSLLFTIIGSF